MADVHFLYNFDGGAGERTDWAWRSDGTSGLDMGDPGASLIDTTTARDGRVHTLVVDTGVGRAGITVIALTYVGAAIQDGRVAAGSGAGAAVCQCFGCANIVIIAARRASAG
jgi:hypothetical protein